MLEQQIASVCQRIESISFYPVCCFTDERILYPSEDAAKQSVLAYDPDFVRVLLMTDGLIRDSIFPDVFYYVSHYEQELTVVMGPFSHKATHKDIQARFCHLHHAPTLSYPIRKGGPAQVRNAASLISELLKSYGIHELNPEAESETSARRDMLLKDESDPSSEEKQFEEQNERMNREPEKLPRAPYRLEKELLDALKNDERERFWTALRRMSEYQAGQYAGSSSKYAEYGLVMLVSAMTRAIIDGGVPSEDAYELSDRLLYEISVARPDQIDSLSEKAFQHFLALSHRYHGAMDVSPHVRRCRIYISHHLNGELDPNTLAAHLGINRDYLLHLFSESTGETLMKYIQRKRVEAAQNMLKYSDDSVQQIADYYQFKTQSHFTRVFREFTGMTPSEYRKKNKPNT